MSLERGVCSFAKLQVFYLLQSLKGSMSGDVRDFNNIEMRSVIKFFSPPTTLKEIHAIRSETLGDRGDFSTCDAPHPGQPKTVTTPEINDQIHELILEDSRILAKSIAEQLGILRERVGSIICEYFDMRKLSLKWVQKCLNADQKHHWCQLSEQLLEFFQRDPNDFLSQ